jgi:hypothetical protein
VIVPENSAPGSTFNIKVAYPFFEFEDPESAAERVPEVAEEEDTSLMLDVAPKN